jgi:hypothetical protein
MRSRIRFSALLCALAGLAWAAQAQEYSDPTGQGDLPPQRPEPADVDLPDGGVTVVMERQLHLPVVQVWIGEDGPYRFGIDTGTSCQLSVSPQLVEDLALAVVDEITVSDGTGQNASRRKVYEVPSLRIGEAEFFELRSISGNYNRGALATEPIEGILGIGLFHGLTLTLDYPGSKVRIGSEPLPKPDGKEILAIYPDELVPTIDWELCGQIVRAHIDARNMGSITVPQDLVENLPLAGKPVKVGEARTQFNTIPIQAAKLKEDLKLGHHVIATPTLTFISLFQNANLGSRVMEQFEVTIDLNNQRIRFRRQGTDSIQLRK